MFEAIQSVTNARVFYEFEVREVQIDFVKVQGVFNKIAVI